MTTMTLREQLEKAKADRAARLAAAAAAKKQEAKPETATAPPKPKKEYRPRNLVLEGTAEEILGSITESLAGSRLPAELAAALEKLPEITAIVEELNGQTPGLREEIAKQYSRAYTKAQKEYYKKVILNSVGHFLPHGISQELVQFGAFTEISVVELEAVKESNKTAKFRTFVYESRSNDGTIHHYTVTAGADWLRYTLRDRHEAIKDAKTSWTERLKKLGISEEGDHQAILADIAMGTVANTVVTIAKENAVDSRGRAVWGSFLVEGRGMDPSGLVINLVFSEFGEGESPMYPVVRPLFYGEWQAKPLRDKGKPEFAFSGMQEKSGKPGGFARMLLLRGLGVKDTRPKTGAMAAAFKAATAPPASAETPAPCWLELPTTTSVPGTPPVESRKMRRTKKFGGSKAGDGITKTSRPAAKPRGGARNTTLEAQNGAESDE